MALRDTWHRTLMYFGLADDEDYEDDLEPYQEPEVEAQHAYSDRSQNVRRLSSRRRRDEFDDIFADDPEADRRTTSLRPVASGSGNGRGGADRMHFVEPKNFNDVQDVADKFKDAIPVSMQRIADKVFLLTPRNVEVSAEQRAELLEKGFFNQS